MTQSDEELADRIESAPEDVHAKIMSIIKLYCREHGLKLSDYAIVLNRTEDSTVRVKSVLLHLDRLPRGLLQILYKLVVFENAADSEEKMRVS